jgi:DNA-binding response OmpR family regulator
MLSVPYLLIVDDDVGALRTLRSALGRDGYELDTASTGEEALTKVKQRRPDAMILDIGMPGISGLDVCRQLRADDKLYDLPILFLTGLDQTEDVVNGLNAGADDYLPKPFEITELAARIRALLRRSGRAAAPSNVIAIGPVQLDANTYRVTITNGNAENAEIQLTRTEYQLLRYLMEHVNQALSPRLLLEQVWDYPPSTGDLDLVRAHIRNLRVKLDKYPNAHEFIRTIHGVGYMVSA